MTGFLCVCGHRSTEHRQWWDVGGAESNGGPSSGFGCDFCGCDDPEKSHRDQ